jgi:hypothetical protein
MSIKKNEISIDKVLEIIENVNKKTKTMTAFEEELGINRSSIKRRIKEHGYYFESNSNQWIKGDVKIVNNKKININDAVTKNSEEVTTTKEVEKKKSDILLDNAVKQIKTLEGISQDVEKKETATENITNKKEEAAPVGRPKKSGEYKRFNMEIPADLLKALKRKALEEDTTATEIIVKLLTDNIENKYR